MTIKGLIVLAAGCCLTSGCKPNTSVAIKSESLSVSAQELKCNITSFGISEAKTNIQLAGRDKEYDNASEVKRRSLLSEFEGQKKISFDIVEKVGAISEKPTFKPVEEWPKVP